MIEFSCRLERPRFVLDAEFSAPSGCVALFGPSGSGKTTVAKLIAGLERPDRGRVTVGGTILLDSDLSIDVPVHKRRVGFVFQDGQLLPHLSVEQNLRYGAYFAAEDAGAASFDTVVDLLGLRPLLAARPATLSGGERQRVAIGRALLAAPRMLVMDEPLASLDMERKAEILPFIERLRDEVALPIVYVSHVIEEVARLATRVVRLSAGKVIAQGHPVEVFAAPALAPDAGRFEVVSFLSGSVVRELPEFGMTILAHPAGEITLPGLFRDKSRALRIAVPATNVTLAKEPPRGLSVRTVLEGKVKAIAAGDGPSALVTLELAGGDRIAAYLTRLALAELEIVVGSTVFALVKAAAIDERAVMAI
jgi:molybdate transport system ATP-binding protein